jgi:hypothetical protein
MTTGTPAQPSDRLADMLRFLLLKNAWRGIKPARHAIRSEASSFGRLHTDLEDRIAKCDLKRVQERGEGGDNLEIPQVSRDGV